MVVDAASLSHLARKNGRIARKFNEEADVGTRKKEETNPKERDGRGVKRRIDVWAKGEAARSRGRKVGGEGAAKRRNGVWAKGKEESERKKREEEEERNREIGRKKPEEEERKQSKDKEMSDYAALFDCDSQMEMGDIRNHQAEICMVETGLSFYPSGPYGPRLRMADNRDEEPPAESIRRGGDKSRDEHQRRGNEHAPRESAQYGLGLEKTIFYICN